jgi:hypothetical protein
MDTIEQVAESPALAEPKAPARSTKGSRTKIPTRSPFTWPAEHAAYLRTIYVNASLAPRHVAERLNAKFGTSYTVKQIYSKVHEQGWTAEKVAKIDEFEKTSGVKHRSIAEQRATAERSNAEIMDRWKERSRKIAEKAFDLAESSKTARDLASATSAVRSIVGTFRQCAGMESTSGAPSLTFNFGFAGGPALPPPEKTVVEIEPSK